MTTLTDSNHVTQTIDAYLAGGLDEAERRAVDAHLAACPDCRVAMELARQADRRLGDAFAAARLPADYERRVVDRLRPGLARAGRRPRLAWPRLAALDPLRPGVAHPAVRRIATAAAAAIVLGAVGFGVQSTREAREAADAADAASHAQGAVAAAEVRKASADARRLQAPRQRDGSPEADAKAAPRGEGFQQQHGDPAVRRSSAVDADFDGAPDFSLTYAKPQAAQTLWYRSDGSQPAAGGEAAARGGQAAVGGAGAADAYRYFQEGSPAVGAGRVAGNSFGENQLGQQRGGGGGQPSDAVTKGKDSPADRPRGVEEANKSSLALGTTSWDASGPGGGARGKLAEDAAGDGQKLAGAKHGAVAPLAAKPPPPAIDGLAVGGAPASEGVAAGGAAAGGGVAGGVVAGTAIAPWYEGAGSSAGPGVNWGFADGRSHGSQGVARGFVGGGRGLGGPGVPADGPVSAAGASGPVVVLSDGENAKKTDKDGGRPGGSTNEFGTQLGLAVVPGANGRTQLGAAFYSDSVTNGTVPGGLPVVTASTPAAGGGGGGAGGAAPATAFKQEVLEAPQVAAGPAFRPAELLARPETEELAARGRGAAVRQPVAQAGKAVAVGQPDDKKADPAKEPGRAKEAKRSAAAGGRGEGAVGEAEAQFDVAAFIAAKPGGGDDKAADGPADPASPPTPGTPPPPEAAGPKPTQSAAPAVAPAAPPASAAPAPAPPQSTTPPQNAATAAPPAAPEPPRPVQRKIIRHGNLQFEIDSFDSALRQVTSIVAEEAGFISTTDSEKLPNGRVRGSVTLRCPPERLDVLVLKLRGLGELKSQKIEAEDVTKAYTDLEAQLTAGRVMYERLLQIIKAGGAVKDLLEAERQLGVWREKLERLEGERRYLENLVSLSTLVVELAERDVRAPTSADERESVSTAVETEDVEKARGDAIKAIEVAKGRVVDSNLMKHEGGQLSATIVADVAPDNAGPVVDRLKQLGKVARLEVTRKTTTAGGTGPIVPGLRVERRETRFQISIYNLAKVAPRQSATLTVAAADVEATYKAVLEQTRGLGATIVASQLSRPRADQMVATVRFEVPTEKSDAASALVRAGVDVMQLQTSVSEDRDNTTDAKRGFSVEIKSLAHVPPRETTTLTLAAPNVPASFAKLLEAARGGGGRVITSQLNEQDPNNITGTIDFEVTRDKWQPVADALAAAGLVVSRNVARSPDTETTVDSKVRLSVAVIDDLRLAPRETVAAQVATATVADTFATIASAARDAGARVVGSNLNLADRTNPNGTLSFAVPRENAIKVETVLKAVGVMVSRTVNRQADGPMNVETKVGFDVRVFDEVQLVPRELVAATVATRQVPEAFNALAEAARAAGARAVGSNLDQADKANPVGRVVFAVPKENAEKFEAALKAAGLLVARTVNRQQDGPMVVDTKAGYDVRVVDERTLVPRESQAMRVVTRNVTDRYAKALETLRLVDAQVTQSRVVQENRNSTVGVLEFVVRRADRQAVEKALSENADVFDRTVARSQDVQGTVDHLVRFSVELRDADQQRPRQTYELSAEVADVDRVAADLDALAAASGGRAEVLPVKANGRSTAVVEVDVPLAKAGDVINAVRAAGTVTSRSTGRNTDVSEGTLSRARLTVTLTPPESVRAQRTLGDTVREGLSTSLTGLFESLRYVIIGLCLVLPWVLVAWAAYRLVRRSRRRAAVVPQVPPVDGPTVPPGGGAGPVVTTA